MSPPDILVLSIGIGIVVSFVFSEIYGLAAGGVVVPGYIALYLHRPYAVLLTLAVALATFGLTKVLSSFLVIYGRRRTSLCVLIGFALGAWFARFGVLPDAFGVEPAELTVIGYIIPGLIAIWFDRQGVAPTAAALAIAAVLVRITLLLAVGTTAVESAI